MGTCCTWLLHSYSRSELHSCLCLCRFHMPWMAKCCRAAVPTSTYVLYWLYACMFESATSQPTVWSSCIWRWCMHSHILLMQMSVKLLSVARYMIRYDMHETCDSCVINFHICSTHALMVYCCIFMRYKVNDNVLLFFSKMQTSFVNTAFSMEYFFVMYSLSDVCVNWIIKFFPSVSYRRYGDIAEGPWLATGCTLDNFPCMCSPPRAPFDHIWAMVWSRARGNITITAL